MTDQSEHHPIRGVNTIQKELDDQLKDNSYRNAFSALGMGAVFTVISFAGLIAHIIFIWAWIFAALGLLSGVMLLVTAHSSEEERHRKIEALRRELAEAQSRQFTATPAVPANETAHNPVPASKPEIAPVPQPPQASVPVAPIPARPPVPLPEPTLQNSAQQPEPPAESPEPAAPAPARFCYRCGGAINPANKFCGACGAKLD